MSFLIAISAPGSLDPELTVVPRQAARPCVGPRHWPKYWVSRQQPAAEVDCGVPQCRRLRQTGELRERFAQEFDRMTVLFIERLDERVIVDRVEHVARDDEAADLDEVPKW